MMEVAGETCKLCLKYIQGDNLAALDEKLLGKLEFLQMDLDQSVEESNSLCKECEEKIEKAFDFKSCVVNIDASGSEDPKQDVSDIPSTSTGESSAEKTMCHLCKNSVDKISVISLPKLLKDDSMMEVFQGHIPEVDLKETENSMVCESCQKSLASFSMLVASWSIANDWNEDEDMKDMDDFEMVQVKKENFDELSDSNTNSSCAIEVSDSVKTSKKGKGKKKVPSSTKVKNEIHEISDSSESASTSKDIKKEETEEAEDAEMEDLQLKNEEVDIKDEDGSSTGIYCKKTLFERFHQEDVNSLVRTNVSKPQHSPPPSKKKYKVKSLTIRKNMNTIKIRYSKEGPHIDVNVPKTNQNATSNILKCSFIDKHTEVREKVDQVFKCGECSYQTLKKDYLWGHSLTHVNFEDLFPYKCQHCSFISKTKGTLMSHFRNTHKVSRKMLACDNCPYTTKYECSIERQTAIHEKTDNSRHKNVEGFLTCQNCPFNSKWKGNLTRNNKNMHQADG